MTKKTPTYSEKLVTLEYTTGTGAKSRLDVAENLKDFLMHVLNGEYKLSHVIKIPEDSTFNVLDIGANYGAFTHYIKTNYPNARVTAVEPNHDVFRVLKRNMKQHKGVTLINAAIIDGTAKVVELFMGKNNTGEASVDRRLTGPDTDSIVVPAIHTESLPQCQWLKMDCEGAEEWILPTYLRKFSTNAPAFITFEYHSEHIRRTLDSVLQSYGYVLCGGHVRTRGFGTFLYHHISVR